MNKYGIDCIDNTLTVHYRLKHWSFIIKVTNSFLSDLYLLNANQGSNRCQVFSFWSWLDPSGDWTINLSHLGKVYYITRKS